MMYHLNDEAVIEAFSRDLAPVLRVEDGATIRISTKDCYRNNLRADNDPRGAASGGKIGSNPASGPIFVEGAQPGDTLKCEILDIELADYATMRIRPNVGYMGAHVTETTVRAIALKDGKAEVGGVSIPLNPMIGVIGVAPAGEAIDTETPGAHGGNMDERHIRKGSTLYLPVHAEGALFAVGDVHAQMGDGEVCVCGLECPAYVTVRLSVIHGRQERWPVLEESGNTYVIASGESLDAAVRLACDGLIEYLKPRVQMNVNELVLMMSLVCDMEVSQLVDPLITARAKLRSGILDVKF